MGFFPFVGELGMESLLDVGERALNISLGSSDWYPPAKLLGFEKGPLIVTAYFACRWREAI